MLGTATKLKKARNIALTGAVSGNANFDGSENIAIVTKQENIAVINGSVTLKGNTSEGLANNDPLQTIWTLDFPTGFNKDNCTCIAFGCRRNDTRGYAFGYSNGYSVRALLGNFERSIQLGYPSDTNKIWCEAYNLATSDIIIYYQIVLMKIS